GRGSFDTPRLLRGEIASQPADALASPKLVDSVQAFRLVEGLEAVAGLESIATTHETALVGRTKERDELLAAWGEAGRGKASAVLIRGEPGLGKSRLVRELRRHVPADGWLEGRCVLENQTTPLRPFADVLSGLDEPFESLLARHGFDPAETVPLFAGLLSQVISARYPP